jgi:hypothetical protein
VALYDALAEAGAIVPAGGGITLGPDAATALARFGVAVPEPGRRLMAYPCLDASEGRPHLGGALGAELARALVARGWVETERATRAAHVTPAGRAGLRRLLGS